MKVEIINKEEAQKLFTLWGQAAAKCYDTPKKYAERIGKSCLESGHFSGSRGTYITFEISDVPRALVDQLVRHEVGTFKNVESGRYVNFSNFDYYVPPIVNRDETLKKLYVEAMENAKISYGAIVAKLNDMGIKGEKAFEVARGVAPMNYNTGLVMGFTVEALINFMHKRLCVCAQEHIMKLAFEMRRKVLELIPELKLYLVAVCDAYGYCPESPKRTCGRYPQKDVLEFMVKKYKTDKTFQEEIDTLKEDK